MPIYEYRCQSCDRETETMQRISDPPLAECDDCGGELKKLISAPAFRFKGSGWYVTDYAKKSGESDNGKGEGKNGADTTTKSAEGKSAEGKSAAGKADGKTAAAPPPPAGATKSERVAAR